jgi:AcrR family transcriptional regulator
MPRRANIRPDEPGQGRIKLAALELFGERGYDATSIADIGERAGITKSVLYHYFQSKADLYRAISTEQTDRLIEAVREALPEDPEAARLRPGVEAYLAFLADRPAVWRLLLRDRPADPQLAALYQELEVQRSEALADSLATPKKRRGESMHIGLVATAIRAFASWWYDHPGVPPGAIADAIMAFAKAGAENIPAGSTAKRRAAA